MKIGILPLGRPTFDVEFAERKLSAMLDCLAQTGHQVIGPRTLLFDADATEQLRSQLRAARQEIPLFDFGGTVDEIKRRCREETGLEPPDAPVFARRGSGLAAG